MIREKIEVQLLYDEEVVATGEISVSLPSFEVAEGVHIWGYELTRENSRKPVKPLLRYVDPGTKEILMEMSPRDYLNREIKEMFPGDHLSYEVKAGAKLIEFVQ